MARDLQANNRKPSHLIGNLCHKKGAPTEADTLTLQESSSWLRQNARVEKFDSDWNHRCPVGFSSLAWVIPPRSSPHRWLYSVGARRPPGLHLCVAHQKGADRSRRRSKEKAPDLGSGENRHL